MPKYFYFIQLLINCFVYCVNSGNKSNSSLILPSFDRIYFKNLLILLCFIYKINLPVNISIKIPPKE
jgi:hypothetical protein